MLKLEPKDRINLVICTFGSVIRWNESRFTDRTNVICKEVGAASYLRKQIASLSTFHHSLSQITFVINTDYDNEESDEFKKVVSEIPAFLGKAKVEILRRGNAGCSFGAFSHVANIYKDAFDYYYFLEDDGIFLANNFDAKLLEQMESDCEMLVTYRMGCLFCSSALVRASAIERMGWNMPFQIGELTRRKIQVPLQNQILASFNTIQSNFLAPYSICSLKYPYGCCPYFGWSAKYQERMIFHLKGKGNKYLLVPTQMVSESLELLEPRFRIDGYVG